MKVLILVISAYLHNFLLFSNQLPFLLSPARKVWLPTLGLLKGYKHPICRRGGRGEAASIIESQLGNPPKGALAPPAASSSQSQLGLNIDQKSSILFSLHYILVSACSHPKDIDQKSSIIFSFEETQTSYLSKLLDSLGYLRCYMHLCSVH